MSSSNKEGLLGERHMPDEHTKDKCMFQNAKKLGFSKQEVTHLKRLYSGKSALIKGEPGSG